MTDPASALLPPVASLPIPSAVDQVLRFPDLISPSTWLLKIIDEVCGVNPVEWFAEKFSGDWERMSRASNALENMADFYESMAQNIGTVRSALGECWAGTAAEAAIGYFQRLDAAVEDQAAPLKSIAREVDNVAQGMKSAMEAIMSMIGSLLDHLIAAAIEAAAGAATSWTLIGGAIGGGAALYSIARAGSLWMDIIHVHAQAMTMVDAVVALAAGYLGSIHGFSTHPLPAGAYNNLQVS